MLPTKNELKDLYDFCLIYGQILEGASLKQSGLLSEFIKDHDDRVRNKTHGPSHIRDRSDTTIVLLGRIEKRFKIALTVPKSNPIRPTKEGERFWNRTRKLLREYQSLSAAGERYTVYISTIDAGAHFWIPQAMKHLKKHESINLCIQVRQWWDVLRDVRDGFADFGIATDFPDDSVHKEQLHSRSHRLVFPKKHQFAKHKRVELKDLGNETVVCMQTASGPVAVEHQLMQHNIDAQIVIVETVAQVLTWIRQGVGVGFLPDEMIPDDLRWCSVDPHLAEAVDMIYTSKEREPSPEANTVRAWIRDYWTAYWNSPKK